ncbi:hypothetical protein ACTOV4_24155 [Brucella sp. C7-11G]
MDKWFYHAKFLMGGLHDSFCDIKEGIKLDEELEEKHRHDVLQIAIDIEAQVKYILPYIVSDMVYETVGTEKLSALMFEVARDQDNHELKRLIACFTLLNLDPSSAMDLMLSNEWTDSMQDSWITGVIESSLHQYYLKQPLTGSVREKFDKLVGSLQQRLAGTKLEGDRMKGVIAQRMGRAALLADMKENNRTSRRRK